MIAIVDYGVGNLFSLRSSLRYLGLAAEVTADADTLRRAERIILPGVGAFADARARLDDTGLTPLLLEEAERKPFLGICLGMHLLFEEGVEGAPREDDETSTHNARGLAVLPGVVTKMPKQDEHSLSYKVPHVGWNTVHFGDGSEGFGGAHQASSARAGQSCGLSERAGLSERLGITPRRRGAGSSSYSVRSTSFTV